MSKRDPQGYYHSLGVSPDASGAEIHRAYEALKKTYRQHLKTVDVARIRRAHDTLVDMERRKDYDGGLRRQHGRRRLRLNLPGLLGVLLLILLGTLVHVAGPAIKAGLTSFRPGETLVWEETLETLGTVRSYEAAHRFANGALAPAYLLERESGEAATWYPARDLARLCRRR